MSRSLLIVGCGYLGKYILRLTQCRRQVFATYRNPEQGQLLHQLGAQIIPCEVTRAVEVAQLPAADVLIYSVNLSAPADVPGSSAWWTGLQHILHHWRKKPGHWRRIILVSSTSVYGQKDESWVTESDATKPDTAAGQLCLEGERLARQATDWAGEVVVVRLSGIYGPGRIVYARHLREGLPISANPDGWLNLIHVADAARAILALADTQRPDSVYNITDDEPVRRRDYWQALTTWLACRLPPIQASPIDAAANRRISNGKIKRELGLAWLYPSFRVGVPASLQEESATASGLCAAPG
ncbi:MAG: NAD-dependent epimerase/dehydratase family protein [Gemmatales bacterium]|nr:NAD-dependent epimerase/dehydratase family protein [Gemmatales bacterium]MDW7993657.1 NAD-dependent epimerase/dehydratase family protein [Gemmatales bacterium]